MKLLTRFVLCSNAAGLALATVLIGLSCANAVRAQAPRPPRDEDHGRPVAQVAKELGVTPEQFRAAFRKVHPAGPGQQPTDAQRNANRRILSVSLGVSPERLEWVMDKYRLGGRGDNGQQGPGGPDARKRPGAPLALNGRAGSGAGESGGPQGRQDRQGGPRDSRARPGGPRDRPGNGGPPDRRGRQGGPELDDQDHGRPVALVAGELGVTPEQFRAAFKKVRPARPGERPTEARRQANRKVLSESLGVSPERLDAVMDKYRPEGRTDGR